MEFTGSETQALHLPGVSFATGIAGPLEWLRRDPIGHLIIKPENILYKKNSKELIFLLADFGYAKTIQEIALRVGTQTYFAP